MGVRSAELRMSLSCVRDPGLGWEIGDEARNERSRSLNASGWRRCGLWALDELGSVPRAAYETERGWLDDRELPDACWAHGSQKMSFAQVR